MYVEGVSLNLQPLSLAADSADRQAARLSQNDRLARVSDYQTRELKMPIKQGLQIIQSAPESSKISSNATTCKTLAADSADRQAARLSQNYHFMVAQFCKT